jgi:hypothetical protein
MQDSARAFVVIDYHNLVLTFKARLAAPKDPDVSIGALIDSIREALLRTHRIEFGISRAYSDFTELGEQAYYVQRDLMLRGIEPRFVPVGVDPNVMDMRLCVDVMGSLGRSEWSTLVLITADREFLPLIQAASDAGKRVVLVCLKQGASSQLVEHLTAGIFVDARPLLSVSDPAVGAFDSADAPTEVFESIESLPYDIDRDALEVIIRHFGQYKEIYLTPLLRKLSDELGHLEGHDPKGLIGDLEACGAVRLEKRRGSRYDFTVLLLNADHPEVIRAREEVTADPFEDPDYDEPDFDESEHNGREKSWQEIGWRHLTDRD